MQIQQKVVSVVAVALRLDLRIDWMMPLSVSSV